MPTVPAAVPLVAGLGLAGAAFSLINRWAKSAAWQDSELLALIDGALVASMLAGFLIFKLGGARPIDVVGKLLLNVVAIVLLVRLGREDHFRVHCMLALGCAPLVNSTEVCG